MPLALLLAVPFFALVLAFTLEGMNRGSNDWLSPLLASIVHPRKSFWGRVLHITLLPFGPLKTAALNAYYAVLHAISHAAAHALSYVTHFFHALVQLEHAYADALVRFELAVAHGFEVGFGHALPRAIDKATRPISARAQRAWKKAAAAAAAAAALSKWAHTLWGHVIRPALHRFAHAIDVTIPRELGRIRTRVHDVETQLSRPTRRWLRRIAAAMWLAYLAGAVVKLLARRFPWLFCRKVKTVGSTICGLDENLFGSLLADVAAIASVISVVAFAREVKAFAEEVTPLLQGFVSELAALPPGDYLD